ncbi:MAG: prepilin-type N-terminal cleavage/methylation domain-containing protein [Minisyncoccia bacterium]
MKNRCLSARPKRNVAGFTLIELLVVIAVIGILASVVLASLNSSRDKAKRARAMADLKSLRNAIALLESDTGKWPNGCRINMPANAEIFLDATSSGINTRPSVGVTDAAGGCEWTAGEVASWNGPYASATIDAWGWSYYFDPDYILADGSVVSVIISLGPNGAVNYQNESGGSDDIVLRLQ